jgi:hypothetical protein
MILLILVIESRSVATANSPLAVWTRSAPLPFLLYLSPDPSSHCLTVTWRPHFHAVAGGSDSHCPRLLPRLRRLPRSSLGRGMRKKGRPVPEWLNSPIWTAPPLAPAPPDPYGADLVPPPPPKPPPPAATAPPMAPPPSYEQAVREGGRRSDEQEEGAGAVLRAHLLADLKTAVRGGFSFGLGFLLGSSCYADWRLCCVVACGCVCAAIEEGGEYGRAPAAGLPRRARWRCGCATGRVEGPHLQSLSLLFGLCGLCCALCLEWSWEFSIFQLESWGLLLTVDPAFL